MSKDPQVSSRFVIKTPANVPAGFFIYHATGAEELCYADENVIKLFVCCMTSAKSLFRWKY